MAVIHWCIRASGDCPCLDRQVLWPEHELHEVNQTVLRVVGDAHWVAQLVPWPDHDVPWVVDDVLWVRKDLSWVIRDLLWVENEVLWVRNEVCDPAETLF